MQRTLNNYCSRLQRQTMRHIIQYIWIFKCPTRTFEKWQPMFYKTRRRSLDEKPPNVWWEGQLNFAIPLDIISKSNMISNKSLFLQSKEYCQPTTNLRPVCLSIVDQSLCQSLTQKYDDLKKHVFQVLKQKVDNFLSSENETWRITGSLRRAQWNVWCLRAQPAVAEPTELLQ